jgi:hypothetical protein
MILEHRAYTMQPGHLERFYELQVERGFDIVRPIMDKVISYFSTVSGPLEQVVHLYVFDSLEDWRSRLHGLYGLPELEAYFPKVRPIMLAQQNNVLLPAPVAELTPHFSAERWWQPSDGPRVEIRPGSSPVVEEQVIALTPGQLPRYWDLIANHGLAAMNPLKTNRIGSFFMMVGPLHQVYHYWFFESFDDRTRRHNAVRMNPEWQRFADEIRPYVASQESKLMVPAPVPEMAPFFKL